MPAGGGAPKQLTYYPAPGPLAERWGYDNQVYGWTPDGLRILFRSARDGYTITDAKLYTVPATGGAAIPLPMPISGAGRFLAGRQADRLFAAVAGFSQREALSGGWANDLYIFDLRRHRRSRWRADHRSTASRTLRPIAIRCGSAMRFISIPTAAAHSICTATISRPPDAAADALHAIGTCAGRAPMPTGRSSTNWTANCISTIRAATRIARCRSPCRPTPPLKRPQPVNAARQHREHRDQPRRRTRAAIVARGDVFTRAGRNTASRAT